jgi:uncharacterized protein
MIASEQAEFPITQTRLQVIDADAHVIETEHTWDFMNPSDAQYRPKLVGEKGDETRQFWLIDGKIRGFRFPRLSQQEQEAFSRRVNRNVVAPVEASELINVDLRLNHMDQIGVDVQVLHNTLFIEEVATRPEVDVALCTGWNRWLADIWKQGQGRLRWSCVLPMLSMPDALDQLAFAQEHGACAIVMRPLEARGRLPYEPYFYPLYEEAVRRNMAIAVHLGNASSTYMDLLRQPYDRSWQFTVFRVPTVGFTHALLSSALPELFPDLRWGIIEAGAGWMPWIAEELARRMPPARQKAAREVFPAHQVYVTCQNNEDLPHILDYAGDDRLLIGTDYGHTDTSAEIDAILAFRDRADIRPEVKEKILSANPKVLYDL